MSAAPDAATTSSRCPRCGAGFRCGMEAGDAECWCASLPPLARIPARGDSGASVAGCYCPACLRALLAEAEAGAQGADRSPDREP